eukprot:4976231-Prymnesium_polylepis.1
MTRTRRLVPTAAAQRGDCPHKRGGTRSKLGGAEHAGRRQGRRSGSREGSSSRVQLKTTEMGLSGAAAILSFEKAAKPSKRAGISLKHSSFVF